MTLRAPSRMSHFQAPKTMFCRTVQRSLSVGFVFDERSVPVAGPKSL